MLELLNQLDLIYDPRVEDIGCFGGDVARTVYVYPVLQFQRTMLELLNQLELDIRSEGGRYWMFGGDVARTVYVCPVLQIQRTMLELLNQLELDGFDTRGDVKVIMAMNRIEILDPVLIRPGQIDNGCENETYL